MSAKKVKGLGRGLEALFGGNAPDASDLLEGGGVRYEEVPLDKVVPGSAQPRARIETESLAELADSIRQQGIISPIVVRIKNQDQYEIIAGERRYQAAKLIGLDTVPVIVREADQSQALAMALIENIQRENLNPIEEASGIQRLIDDCGYTHEEAAQAIGRSRSGVTNMLRLLGLTEEVKQMVTRGELEMGHARALLALEGAEQILVAKDIAARGLSVRQAEDLVSKRRETRPAKKKVVIKTRDDLRLEEALAESLGAVVKLTANQKGRGRIVIEFANLDQLQGIVDRIQQRLE
ncbi:MAG: ParB/RepB/Spo0J family partition protein [Sutterella sp.]|nr:ParB/RepB/Spo0J family partition protein [Sutterella sp.]